MNRPGLFDTLLAAGYGTERLPAFLEPGKFYRLPAPGKRGTDGSGWLTLIREGLASYGDWTTGASHTWSAAANDNRPSRAANDNHADRAAIEHRKALDRARAADTARRIWDSAKPAREHAYLTRKGIKAHGARLDDYGRLLVPVYHAITGELASVQRIDQDGEKQFLKGGAAKLGHYTIPGTLPRIFCEGFATGATIHEATGRAVVICFNAGNLVEVAAVLAEPGDAVGADNDNAAKPGERFGKRLDSYGTGHRKAIETGLPFFMPHTPGHDWNDAGTEAAAAAFAGEPTSAAPILNAWTVKRVEPSGKTPKQWAKELAAATDHEQAAGLALAAASRMFMVAPAQLSLGAIRATVEAALRPGMVHPATLDGIMVRLEAAMSYRKAAALAPVTIPAEILARHRHEVCDELPSLTEADYHGVIVLWAPMASGKTRRIGAPFAKWARRQSLPLAICHRVSLVHDMARALDVDPYDQVGAADARYPDNLRGLATCLPSITTAAHAPLIDQAEYLFVDEVSQVLRFLEASDHCRTKEANHEGVYNRLHELVSRARCLIVADAGCDARTMAFLESCRPAGERFRVIEMRQQKQGIEATYHTGGDAPAAVVGECLEELASGGRVWIATESSRRAEVLGEFFKAQGYTALAVTADTKGEADQEAFLAAPEAESLRYDVVIASPVIGSGLSIEHKEAGEHFTLCAFIGGGHRVTPADAAQAMRRVRYIRRFSLGLLPNSQVGKQAPESILRAWEEAAELEGRPAFANSFSALVSSIKADQDNARADFAAGLLWQLERAGWALYQGERDQDVGIVASLAEVKQQQEDAHRAALLAAPILTDDEARALESKQGRTQLQNLTLEAWRIRAALGLDALDERALDFWDNGAAVRRLDRFSAWRGVVGAFDDTRENLASRRYRKAVAKAYGALFDGIDLAAVRWTDDLAALVLDRIIARRHLLAHLGLVPKTYGVWMEDREGEPLPFTRPKNARQELAEVLRRMGLEWRALTVRVAHTPAQTTLENMGQGACKPKTKNARVYVVTAESLAEMERRAESRNARRRVAVVEQEPTPAAWSAPDDAYWLGIRRRLLAAAPTMTRDQAAAELVPLLKARPPTAAARCTVLWAREVLTLADKLAA